MKSHTLRTIASFCRNEAVLCIAFVCAFVSSFFVPAGHNFASSVDLRVIILLFCLMGATAGLQNAGVLFPQRVLPSLESLWIQAA